MWINNAAMERPNGSARKFRFACNEGGYRRIPSRMCTANEMDRGQIPICMRGNQFISKVSHIEIAPRFVYGAILLSDESYHLPKLSPPRIVACHFSAIIWKRMARLSVKTEMVARTNGRKLANGLSRVARAELECRTETGGTKRLIGRASCA